MRRAAVTAVIFLVPLVISVSVTLLEGTSEQLPWIALGSDVLLHVERATLLLWLLVLLLVALVRTSRGELPVELSSTGIRYEVGEVADDLVESVDELKTQAVDQKLVQERLSYRIQQVEHMIRGRL